MQFIKTSLFIVKNKWTYNGFKTSVKFTKNKLKLHYMLFQNIWVIKIKNSAQAEGYTD